MTDTTALADALSALVRGTAGVEELYPTAPVLQAVVGALVNKVVDVITPVERTLAPADAGVAVSESASGWTVETRIAVSVGESAADVSRNVYATIADYLTQHAPGETGTITVKVARIT